MKLIKSYKSFQIKEIEKILKEREKFIKEHRYEFEPIIIDYIGMIKYSKIK
jgi:hypothetical protein